MPETLLPYHCRCGGTLKQSQCPVEFYGLDFGVQQCELCTKCGAEYLDDEIIGKIEQEVKKRKLFGLERRVTVTKSGNSLVMRLPPEIVEFTDINYKDTLRILPLNKKRIEVEVLG